MITKLSRPFHQIYLLAFIMFQTSYKSSVETAKNFLEFKAPALLQSDNECKFVNCVSTKLVEQRLNLKIVYERPRYPQSQDSMKCVTKMSNICCWRKC